MVAERDVADALIAALQGVPGLVSAYLFGSVASGRAHRQSDVDVGILLDHRDFPSAGERFDLRLRLIGDLQGAVGRDVDLVVLNDAPPQLARHIMAGGRRLLVKDAERDHAALRVMLSRAADLEPFLQRLRAVKLQSLAR